MKGRKIRKKTKIVGRISELFVRGNAAFPAKRHEKSHSQKRMAFWRSGWDSNPRGIAPKLISSHFPLMTFGGN